MKGTGQMRQDIKIGGELMIKGEKISENITIDIINAREKKWKVVLPESFKKFMLDNNGIIPDERITIKTGIALEKFLCIVPVIAESPNATDDIDVVIAKYDEFMVFDEDSVGPDLIPFARLSGDKLLCLCYEDKNPQIAVWSFEGSEDFVPNYKKVYSSFDEFLIANNIIHEHIKMLDTTKP